MREFLVKATMAGGMLAALLALAGCSSMSANECVATDWRTVGFEDGVAGYAGDRIGQYRKACGKHGVAPDLAEYQHGRSQGLQEYCRPLNGFRVGARGRGYNGICPEALDGAFMEAWQSGRQLHHLRARVADTANQIENLQAESARLEADIVDAATRILSPSLTTEQRAQLLVDSKHMAERKGEIKARLPQLESDLEHYRRELDDYRATLTYVE